MSSKRGLFLPIIVVLLFTGMIVTGCDVITGASPGGEGFAIYLTSETGPQFEPPELNDLRIAGEPLITEKDIISYDWNAHEITLTPEAFMKFSGESPEVEVGSTFAVCIDSQPVYGGIFFSSYMSRTYDGIVIVIGNVFVKKENTIRIGSGYPWDIGRDDLCSNTRIKQALEASGKLNDIAETITSSNSENEGFAIYLTTYDIPALEIPELDKAEPFGPPVLTQDDIVSYDWETHRITLRPEAFKIINDMMPPVWGTAFVVCVDGEPVYRGAFWPGYSSMSFDGIVIMTPVFEEQENTIRIDLGYVQSYSGADPRGNERIRQSLESAGKLK